MCRARPGCPTATLDISAGRCHPRWGAIYGVGIDPGAAQTLCVIVEAGKGYVQHVGSAMVESGGWKRGMVVEAGLVAERMAALENAAYGIPLGWAVFGGNMDDPGLANAIARSGISVEDCLESIVAAAEVVLNPTEREVGP